jgi:flagellar biogenesis protein FliO|tara:strand:+ start:936 stop:1259 length:324 start_codon:yes stop_codon:yes gene_type:complete
LDEISSQFIVRALVSLIFVLTVLGALLWWLKSKGPALGLGVEEGSQLQVLSRMQMDARNKLILIKAGDARFLVATSPSGISVTPVDSVKPQAEFKDYYKAQIDNQDS